MIVKIINTADVNLFDARNCKFFAEGGKAWVVIDTDDESGGQTYPVEVKAYVMNDAGATIDTFVPKR